MAVTVVGRFAPHAAPEIADGLRGVFVDDGVNLIEERAVPVDAYRGGVVARTSSGVQVTGERLLAATDRFADTGDLGLERPLSRLAATTRDGVSRASTPGSAHQG